jgi:acetyl esterase/lipase
MHGGNWESGDKAQYKFLGNRLARKGILAVIINYRHPARITLLGDGR